jgi:hypothetical protein
MDICFKIHHCRSSREVLAYSRETRGSPLRADRGFVVQTKGVCWSPARTWAFRRQCPNCGQDLRADGRAPEANKHPGAGSCRRGLPHRKQRRYGQTANGAQGFIERSGRLPTAPSSSFDKERDETDELNRRPQSPCCAAGREIHLGTSSGRTYPAGEILCANLLVRRVRECVWCHGANGTFGSTCQTISRNGSGISRRSTNAQDSVRRSWKGLSIRAARYASETHVMGLILWPFV